jgi:hypothetical protein
LVSGRQADFIGKIRGLLMNPLYVQSWIDLQRIQAREKRRTWLRSAFHATAWLAAAGMLVEIIARWP